MTESRSSSNLALWSIPVAVAILLIKTLAWQMTGSVALLSDALESIVNVVAALVAWYALTIAAQPSDQRHPFGHHKAEYLSAVVEGVLIVVAALLIFQEAISALSRPRLAEAPWLGLAVNVVAGAANAAWATVLVRQGRRRRSPALEASGKHLFADVWTSVGVVVGVGLAVVTGWHILDPILAMLVGVNILREGFVVIMASVDGLMDASADDDDKEHIDRIVADCAAGALQIHDLRTRKAGPKLFVEFHLVVPGEMTVAKSHDICDRIEQGIAAQFPGAFTTIHVEPEAMAKADGIEPSITAEGS